MAHSIYEYEEESSNTIEISERTSDLGIMSRGLNVTESDDLIEDETSKNKLTAKYKAIHKGGRGEKIRSLKMQEKEVKRIAIKYSIALQKLISEGEDNIGQYVLYDSKSKLHDLRDSLSQQTNMSVSRKTILSVDLALLNVGPDESLILYNDFFFPHARKWWTDHFSRSVYYRVRRRAIKNFIGVANICING